MLFTDEMKESYLLVEKDLEELKKLGKQFRQELPLLEETDKPSYSDVALVLRNYLDLCTFYMKKRYGTTCHEKRR